ncbi:hypothetical protein V8C44DRAFT_79493 [Trichoderma aethiopicum]
MKLVSRSCPQTERHRTTRLVSYFLSLASPLSQPATFLLSFSLPPFKTLRQLCFLTCSPSSRAVVSAVLTLACSALQLSDFCFLLPSSRRSILMDGLLFHNPIDSSFDALAHNLGSSRPKRKPT